MLTTIPTGSYLKAGLTMIYKALSPIFRTKNKIEQPNDFIRFVNNNPKDISDMFYGSDVRNIPHALDTLFDLSKVEYADRMFKEATFNILKLNMPKLRSAKNMFEGATGGRLSSCDFRGLVDTTEMFKFSCIDNIDTQNMPQVEIAKNMFEGSRMKHFEQFKFKSLKNVIGMFRGTYMSEVDSNGFENVEVYTNIFDAATVKCGFQGKLKEIAEEYGFKRIAKNK